MTTARPHIYSNDGVTNAVESAANTETVVATLVGVTAEFAQQQIQFMVVAAITPGTTATAMTLRIRRTSLTGTLVETADVHAGDIQPSKLSVLAMGKMDTGIEPAGLTYVLTAQGTGEGTAAAFTYAMLTAIVS